MQNFTFGKPALVVLFRGGGNLLNPLPSSGESGIDTLNTRLQSTFSDYYLISEVFDSYEGNVFSFREIGSPQGKAFVEMFDGTEAIGLVGYSAGGLSSIRLAKHLAPRTVELLVQIDSYEPLTGTSLEDEVLPGNVAKGINYYQDANPFNIADLQGAKVVEGSENINVESLLDDDSITHLSIVNNAELQTEILADIDEFVLQDLAFDPTEQLSLSEGAQLVANVLSLAPGEAPIAGKALIADPIVINPDFSFSTRFEFRMLADTHSTLPGFSFWVEPAIDLQTEKITSPLAIAFNPTALAAPPIAENAVAVLTPAESPTPLTQTIVPLDLDSGDPLTAWVDYDGLTDQLSVFLGETLTQPTTPFLTSEIDLFAIVGSEAQFGFQAAVGEAARQAELLTWQLSTMPEAPPTVETYLNVNLTQRATAAFTDLDFSFAPFEVNGLEFSTLFDETTYLRLNSDVLRAVDAGAFSSGYDHFTQFGWREGRPPSSLYDELFYLATNPDVAQAVDAGAISSGFVHFVQHGHVEGRDPSARFDQDAYLSNNPDVAAAISQGTFLSGFEHYIEQGAAEGRSPDLLLFQEGYYLTENPDVNSAVAAGAFTDGFNHYLSFGCREGRNPTSFFSESQYLALHSDVAAAVESGDLTCGWEHYLFFGRFEGRGL